MKSAIAVVKTGGCLDSYDADFINAAIIYFLRN